VLLGNFRQKLPTKYDNKSLLAEVTTKHDSSNLPAEVTTPKLANNNQ
jgi:hypothetical protein